MAIRGDESEQREIATRPLIGEIDQILSARGAARVEKLLASPELPRLVALLPPEELFFTLKETGDENLPELLAHARAEQVQFVLDLDLWRKDRLRPERAAAWLNRLADAGEVALRRWLKQLEPSTWLVLLSSLAKVHVADAEADPFQEATGRAPFTLDGVHYVSAAEEAEPVLRQVLSSAREEDPQLYYRLMESIPRDPDPEVEENAFDEKQRRLAQRGFPSWDEAYEVYARVSPLTLDSLSRRDDAALRQPEEPEVAPRYALTAGGASTDFLSRVLARVPAAALEAVRGELAYLTNKVIVADGLDASELDSYNRALRKVAGYVSVGVELFGGPDEATGAALVQRHWLQQLFRAGWTRVRQGQSKAHRFLDKSWPSGRLERLLFLDSPLPEIVDGLLRRHPQWYAGEAEEPALRDFGSLSEVERAERAVEKSDFLGTFLLSVVDFRLEDLQDAALRLDTENLKSRTVFLTALLNAALERGFRFAPVERQAAAVGLAKLWTADEPPRRIRSELLDAAFQWSKAVARPSGQHETFLDEFIDDALALLEEEFGHLAPGELPDPRFTKGLWIV